MNDGYQRARINEVTSPKEFIKGLIVPLINGLKQVVTFSDFWSVKKDLWILKENLLNGNIIIEGQVAEHLWFMMTEVDSILLHLRFD